MPFAQNYCLKFSLRINYFFNNIFVNKAKTIYSKKQ